MGARHGVLKGNRYSATVRSYYEISAHAFPQCRHCGRLVGFRRMRDHLLYAGVDPTRQFSGPSPPGVGVAA